MEIGSTICLNSSNAVSYKSINVLIEQGYRTLDGLATLDASDMEKLGTLLNDQDNLLEAGRTLGKALSKPSFRNLGRGGSLGTCIGSVYAKLSAVQLDRTPVSSACGQLCRVQLFYFRSVVSSDRFSWRIGASAKLAGDR